MHHERNHQQSGTHGAAMPPNEPHSFLHQSQESAEVCNAAAPQDLRIGNLVIPGVRLQPNVIAPANVMSGYYGAPPPPSLKTGGGMGGTGPPNDGVDGPLGGDGGACPPPTMPLKRFVTPEDDEVTAAARAALGGPPSATDTLAPGLKKSRFDFSASTDTLAPGLKKSRFDFSAGSTAVPFSEDCIIGGGSLTSIPEDRDFSFATGGSVKSCAPILPTTSKIDNAEGKMDAGGANSFLPPHIRQLLQQQQPQAQALTQPLPTIPCGRKNPVEHKPASPSLVSDYLTGKLDNHENMVRSTSVPGQSGPNKRKRPDDDPEDRPLVRGEDVHDNDVLCGRGGGTNHNVGNKRYRDLVRYYQPLYVVVPKREKLRVSKGIVAAVRHAEPPGRFLERVADAKPQSGGSSGEAAERYAGSALYRDIGDRRAWDKTSQTLREGAPEIRKNAEIEKAVAAARIGCGSWVTHLQAAVRRQEEKDAEKGRRTVPGGAGTGSGAGTGTEAAALHATALLGSAGGKERQEGDRDAGAANATAIAATLARREEEARLRRQQQQRLADAGSVSTLALPSAHLAASSLMGSQNQLLAAAVAQAAGGAKSRANNLDASYINSLIGGPQAQLGNYHSSTPFGVAPGTTTAASLTGKSALERYIAGSVIANPPQLVPTDTLSSSARTIPLPSAATVSLSACSTAGDVPGASRRLPDPQAEGKFHGADLPLDKVKKAGAVMVPSARRTRGDQAASTRSDTGDKSCTVKERSRPAEAKAKMEETPRRSSVPLPQPTLSRRGNGRRSTLPHVAVDHSPPEADNKEGMSDVTKSSNGKVGGLSPSDARGQGENGRGPDVAPKVSRRRSSSKRIYEEQIRAAQAYIKHLTSLQQEQDEIEDEEQSSDASERLEVGSGSDGDGRCSRETTHQLSIADGAISQKAKSHLQVSSLERIASSAMAAYRERKASSQPNLSGGGRDSETADSGRSCPSIKEVEPSVPKMIPNSDSGKEMFGNGQVGTLKRTVETVDKKDGSFMPTSQQQFSSLMQLSQVAFALDEGRGGQKTEDSTESEFKDGVVGKRSPPLPLKKRLRGVEVMVPKEPTSLPEGPKMEPTSLREGPKMPPLPQTVLLRGMANAHEGLSGCEDVNGHILDGSRNRTQHADNGHDMGSKNYMRTNKGQPGRREGKGPNLLSDNLGGGVNAHAVHKHQGKQYEIMSPSAASLDAVTTAAKKDVGSASVGDGDGFGMTHHIPVVDQVVDEKMRKDAIMNALRASSGKVGPNEAVSAGRASFRGTTLNEAGMRPASHPAASLLPLSLGDQVNLLRRLQMCTSAGIELRPQELFSSSQPTGTGRNGIYQGLASTAGVESQSEAEFISLLQRALRQQRETTLDTLSAHARGKFSKGPLP